MSTELIIGIIAVIVVIVDVALMIYIPGKS